MHKNILKHHRRMHLRLIPAIPPEDYDGSQAEWMTTLIAWGYWDGEGWHGDVMLPENVWCAILAQCESKHDSSHESTKFTKFISKIISKL